MARRLTALCVGLWFIALTILGARHEAQVRHVIDTHGNAVHAQHMHGEHTGDQSDVHESDSGADSDACDLVAALHAAAWTPTTPLAIALTTLALPIAEPRFLAAPIARPIYRLAPKTSPPTAS